MFNGQCSFGDFRHFDRFRCFFSLGLKISLDLGQGFYRFFCSGYVLWGLVACMYCDLGLLGLRDRLFKTGGKISLVELFFLGN